MNFRSGVTLGSKILLLGAISASVGPYVAYGQHAELQQLKSGNPDQAWGARRPVTEADRRAIASYRSGNHQPMYKTTFDDPQRLADEWAFKHDDYLQSCRRPENVVGTPNGLELQTRIAEDCKAKWSTGFITSKQRFAFGFYEASIKAANIDGLNNAFWLVTEDKFEIDIAELHYPNIDRMTLHGRNGGEEGQSAAVGFDGRFSGTFDSAYHDIGVLWTPTDIVFEVDGEPVAAIRTNDAIHGRADIRFSTALMDYAGKIPQHPEGHSMYVKSLRVYQQKNQ